MSSSPTVAGPGAGCVVVGTPGRHARGLMRAARRRQWVSWGVALVCAGAAWGSVRLGFPLLDSVVAALATVAAAATGASFASRASKAAVGWRSERDTVAALQRANVPAVVYCGLLLGAGGDADLVVVSHPHSPQPRVFVVEIKTVWGRASVRGDQLCSNGRPLPRQPAAQVRRQRDALARRGISSQPVVVASRATLPRGGLSVSGVPVVTSAGLPAFVRSHPAPWSTIAVNSLRCLAHSQDLLQLARYAHLVAPGEIRRSGISR